MSSINQRVLFKVLPYPVIFFIGGLMYLFIESGLLGQSKIYPATGVPYNLNTSIVTVLSMTIIVGIILGFIEELAFKKGMKNMRFSFKILTKTVLYLSIFIITQFAFSIVINTVNSGKTMIDTEVIASVIDFFSSYSLLSIVIYGGFIINISLFFSEIVDYLGIDVVGNFFSGKYSNPVFEKRIFMFLDMKDSTSIAEKIGHKKQHELMDEYYSDMSDAIVETKGSIYQYVGDEIVISWTMEDGLKDCNSIECFFLIEQRISEKADEYHANFGVVPKFKAGLHSGEVTRGQIGDIKRDLLYIGDVLNSTSRIQGLCNQLDTNFLISSHLKEQYPKNCYEFRPIGEFELKGRVKREELFSILKSEADLGN